MAPLEPDEEGDMGKTINKNLYAFLKHLICRRGPNKYTRTWEDEDAYKPLKPVKINPKKPRNPTKEEYPALTSPSEESHEGASGDHNEEENEKLEETLQSKS